MPVKQTDGDEVEIEITRRFAMVARQNAQTSGIIRDRFVKTEFGGKIRDRLHDRAACSGFSARVLAGEIIAECVMDFLQLAQESFILRNFLQARLPRELEHAHRVVIGPVPKLGVEMTKQAARRGLPRPPKVEAHLAQRLQRRRQGRSHVIGLKGRYGRSGKWGTERELIKKMSRGKL